MDFVATPDSSSAPVIRFPNSQLDLWHYEQILTKKFPFVVVEIGEPAFELLCDVLENAIILSRPLGLPRHPEDLSNMWCSSVEMGSGVHIDGQTPSVSAIRDTAELLANADPPSVPRRSILAKKAKTNFQEARAQSSEASPSTIGYDRCRVNALESRHA